MGNASNKMVLTPTGNTYTDSEKGLLPNEKLNEKARKLEILTELKNNSLISIFRLADSGYTSIFIQMTEG